MTTHKEKLVEFYQNLKILNSHFAPSVWQRGPIQAIFKRGIKRIFIKAGRSSGKSHVSKYLLNRIAVCFKNQSAYMIGPTRKQQVEIAWEQVDGLPRFIPIKEFGGVAKESEHRIEYKNGSFIKIDGSEEHASYRGVPFDIMVLDEFQNQDPRFYTSILPNIFKRPNAILVVIGHPLVGEDNHFDVLWEEAVKDTQRWATFHATCFDNPHLSSSDLMAEKQKYIARGDLVEWMTEYEAIKIAGGKRAIFPPFNKSAHVRPRQIILDEIEKDKHKLLWGHGLDPGSATVFGGALVAYNPNIGKVYILDEIYEKNPAKISTSCIWPHVQGQKKTYVPQGAHYVAVYDEAAKWFEREVTHLFGDALIPSNKAQNDKEDGISLIKDLMIGRNPKFVIAEECENAIKEFQASRDEKGEIPKRVLHFLDSFRYVLYELGVVARPALDDSQVEAMPRSRIASERGPRYDTSRNSQIYSPEEYIENLIWKPF